MRMCECERGFSQRWVGIGGVAGGVESKGGSQHQETYFWYIVDQKAI